MTLANGGTPVEVSVLVPAKDEAENLPEFVRQCAAALEPVAYGCELIVVNDGSEDDKTVYGRARERERRFRPRAAISR